MEEDLIVSCLALYQSLREERRHEMHEKGKEVSKPNRVKKAGWKVSGFWNVCMENLAERRCLRCQRRASSRERL